MSSTVYSTFPFAKPPELTALDVAPPLPITPSAWECTALLHPYSPPPSNDPKTTPFFQLCIANLSFIEGTVFSIQITGLSYGTWWYKVTPDGTTVSYDQGGTWSAIDIGWTLPSTSWMQSNASYFKTGYLNWMEAQEAEWWKQPVAGSNATTWIWYDAATRFPFRLMFGAPPADPVKGDPNQLALFQNFSFTYLPSFTATNNPNISTWQPVDIPGFQAGNPNNYKLVEWNDRFSMTTIMTPVDSASFPLPTAVLYQWKPDDQYVTTADRTQCTIMSYEYNPQAGFTAQVAMLYGVAPAGVQPPPFAGNGYIFNEMVYVVRGFPTPIVTSCENIGLGQEPPNWASIPAVDGTVHATISNNPALCPGEVVNIISVLFPPTQEYPDGRYLWTWYSPFPGSDGSQARPVTFMESASSIAEGGTSLALADYFEYVESPFWFPSEFFDLPLLCQSKNPPGKT